MMRSLRIATDKRKGSFGPQFGNFMATITLLWGLGQCTMWQGIKIAHFIGRE